MVDRAYKNLNSEFMDNQDARGPIDNDKTGQPICIEDADPTAQSSQAHESNMAPGDFMPEILNDDKIAANMNKSLKVWFLMC